MKYHCASVWFGNWQEDCTDCKKFETHTKIWYCTSYLHNLGFYKDKNLINLCIVLSSESFRLEGNLCKYILLGLYYIMTKVSYNLKLRLKWGINLKRVHF